MKNLQNVVKQKNLLFGTGALYDKVRHKYPMEYLKEILSNLKYRRNYIDIATGTGQLLFNLAPNFTNNIIGNDFNEQRLNIARQRSLQYNKQNKIPITILSCDCYELFENLKQQKNIRPQEFDLITMGNALHWMETNKICTIIKQQLMHKDSIFAILGCICVGSLYNCNEDKQFMQMGNDHFAKFMENMKPYWEHDIDILTSGYKKLHLDKLFQVVSFKEEIILDKASLVQLKQYCQTLSAYNLYLEKKNNMKKNIDDPIDGMIKNMRKDIIEKQQSSTIKIKSNEEILMKVYYFQWILKKL